MTDCIDASVIERLITGAGNIAPFVILFGMVLLWDYVKARMNYKERTASGN